MPFIARVLESQPGAAVPHWLRHPLAPQEGGTPLWRVGAILKAREAGLGDVPGKHAGRTRNSLDGPAGRHPPPPFGSAQGYGGQATG